MKIGVITFHSAHNYGAVLQAWSLQEYLRQQGHEVEIVNLRLPVIDKVYSLVSKKDKKITGNGRIDHLVNCVYRQLRWLYWWLHPKTGKIEKYRKFEHFINHVLPVTERFEDHGALRGAALTYDALIAGSDQIWNAVILKGIDPAYFLQFANRDAIRISYAASIGTEEIGEGYKMMFRRYLRDFDHISVREKKAKEEVEKLTDSPVDLVADPTFLLKREDFDRLMVRFKAKKKYIYVHNVHINRVDEALNGVVEEMSQRLGLPVIHNWGSKVFSNEAGHFTGGAEEFLGLVAAAEYVITNSFHCTVFAIIYQKDFITVPHYKHPDRMRNLLESLGLSEHLIGGRKEIPKDLSRLSIDHPAVEEKKAAMSAHAKGFLQKALAEKKTDNTSSYLEGGDIFSCYGCGACKDACPVQAITMEEDQEGFFYPVVDGEACGDCGRCKDVCISRQQDSGQGEKADIRIAYTARHKDEEVVGRSTDGGVFTALYRVILEQGGCVAGVRYDADLEAVYGVASDEMGCRQFCGSKYVYADSGDIKTQVKALLEQGKTILFTGTPCQVAGLKSFLGEDHPRLYTAEMSCKGGGSPKVFRKYCDHLEETYRSKLTGIQFDNKFKGPETSFVVTEFASGSIDVEDGMTHAYKRAYQDGIIQRPSCYVCAFAGQEKGAADLVLGGHKGESIVKVCTEKGTDLFGSAKKDLVSKKISWEKACAAGQTEPLQMNAKRSEVLEHMDEKPIDELLAVDIKR